MTPKIKKASASPLADVLHCHHRRKLKHTICPSCHNSFAYCPECEDAAECCARCKAAVVGEQRDWFTLMHHVVKEAA